MPESFDACVKAGGKVRRINGPNEKFKVPAGYYRNICIDKDGGVHWGHLKKKKEEKDGEG